MYYPKVVIIILNWNGKEDTIECLGSLNHITYPNYEIILVDNGSMDGSVECFRGLYPEIEIIENEDNFGFAEGNNVGIRRALDKDSKYVLLLNNDTIVDRKFLMELVEVAESDDKIGAVQSKILRKDNSNIIDSAGQEINIFGAKDIGFSEIDDGRFDSIHDIFGGCAAACIYKKIIFEKVGLFNKNFFILYEDVDLSWRIRLAGYSIVFAPASIVFHKRGISGGNCELQTSSIILYHSNKNTLILYIKYLPISIILKTFPLFIHKVFIFLKMNNKLFDKSNDDVKYLASLIKHRKKIQSNKLIKEINTKYLKKESITKMYINILKNRIYKLL